jgi:hypothetical protein
METMTTMKHSMTKNITIPGKLKRVVIVLIGLGCVWLLAGCASLAGESRVEGFRIVQQGFESIEGTGRVHEVVELRNVIVHIVSDRGDFDWEEASAYGSPVLGYARRNNEIHVLGKRVGDKIVVNQAILGHELNHLLNFKNSNIANPDQLDDLGT